jgi:UDP:flavonoid glycosyltransferase YjiC (YdhE family)
VPTLILRVGADQPVWATHVKRLEVGTARRFSTTDRNRLADALRKVLSPEVGARARQVAVRLTTREASVSAAADLLEEKAGVMAAK